MSNKFQALLSNSDQSFISDRFYQSHRGNFHRWLLLLLSSLLSCILPSVTLAQSAPLTNPAAIAAQEQLRQQERERVQRQQQEIRPDVRLSCGGNPNGSYSTDTPPRSSQELIRENFSKKSKEIWICMTSQNYHFTGKYWPQ